MRGISSCRAVSFILMADKKLGDGVMAVAAGVALGACSPGAGVAIGVGPVGDEETDDVEMTVGGGDAKGGMRHFVGAVDVWVCAGVEELGGDFVVAKGGGVGEGSPSA